MNLPSLKDVHLSGKRVLVRADLNVPMHQGRIADTTRIDRFLDTLRMLIRKNAAVIIASHLGRPRLEEYEGYSLEPIAKNINVDFIPDLTQEIQVNPGNACLLENLRFHTGEENNDPGFARTLANHAEIYVNDAFACAHRSHASTYEITSFLPAYAGPGLITEIRNLENILSTLETPSMAIVGGNKIASKMPTLENLVRKVNLLVIGGGMTNTFLATGGSSFRLSSCEFQAISHAKELLELAKQTGCEILIPEDIVTAQHPEQVTAGSADLTKDTKDLPYGMRAYDIGAKSVVEIISRLRNAKSLIWNGPLGMYENPPFQEGTFAIAHEAAALCKAGKLTVLAGGGDTIAAFQQSGTFQDFSYVSMGGGAFLDWLQQKKLPAIEALQRNPPSRDLIRRRTNPDPENA